MTAPWVSKAGAGVELAPGKVDGQGAEVTLGATAAHGGTRARTVTIGGETTLSYMFTEGGMPHRPAVAIEILDQKPDDWSPLLVKAWGDAMNDPASWAKAAEAKGADAILLRLTAARGGWQAQYRRQRPGHGAQGAPGHRPAAVVYGPGQVDAGQRAAGGRGRGRQRASGWCWACARRRTIAPSWPLRWPTSNWSIASTAMDVNLAKQLNILVSDMGLPLDRILMDPTCAAVGYGLEYGYSVMERLRMAALTGDKMTQLPMIVTVGYEAWRQKESKVGDGRARRPGATGKSGPSTGRQ